MWEPSMGLPQVTQTSIKVTATQISSEGKLINAISVITNNCNDTEIVTSSVYIWYASRHQQSNIMKVSWLASWLGAVHIYK
jgi:hypothetical protein